MNGEVELTEPTDPDVDVRIGAQRIYATANVVVSVVAGLGAVLLGETKIHAVLG